MISIDLDGQSTKDVCVTVPWDSVRNITEGIIERCVSGAGIGGWETAGLKRAFDAVINPLLVSPEADRGSAPVGVVNPDGSITSVAYTESTNQDPPSLSECVFIDFCCGRAETHDLETHKYPQISPYTWSLQ